MRGPWTEKTTRNVIMICNNQLAHVLSTHLPTFSVTAEVKYNTVTELTLLSVTGADHDTLHRIPGPNLRFIPRIPS